jgi:hypothetical protein
MAESAAQTRVVRPGTTRQRDRREKEMHVPREPAVRTRRAESDDAPGMRPFARTERSEEPKELKAFAVAPDDTPPPPPPATWGSRPA